MQRRNQTLARLALLAALALAGRMAFLWAPNVALTYLVVFLAGLLYGPRLAAGVAILSMTLSNLFLSGLHPVLLVTGPAMALVGITGGLAGRLVNLGQAADLARRWPAAIFAGAIGLLATLGFSLAADLGNYLLFHVLPQGAPQGTPLLSAYLLRGLAFNVPAAAANAVLFAVATYPVARAVRRAGLLDGDTHPTEAADGPESPQADPRPNA